MGCKASNQTHSLIHSYLYMSRIMRKPIYAICEQQRRRSTCASAQSDQRLCCSLPRYYNSSSFYIQNFKPLASVCGCAGRFESYLVGNPEDRFSCDEAHTLYMHFLAFWSTVPKSILGCSVLVRILLDEISQKEHGLETNCPSTITGISCQLFLWNTVMILSFQTDMPGQTVQTQIRLFLEEQSDQGLHCLPFRLHCLDSLLYGRAT